MECWNLAESYKDDFITYTRVINCICENFKFQELTQDMFKSVIFVKGLMATEDRKIWARIILKMEQAN